MNCCLPDVLVCGVYIADRENWAADEIRELASSRQHDVEQRWTALDVSGSGQTDLPCTVSVVSEPTGKFTLINRLIENVEKFDWLLVCDDDIRLPLGFLDQYLAHAHRFGFALSQPARTADSYVDHRIVTQMPGLTGRLTRFVEIGPVFCIHRSAYPLLLPFDGRTSMGWGLDFVWPLLLEPRKLRMGIIDATPVAHSLRKPVANYSHQSGVKDMEGFLAQTPHLTRAEAFTVIEAYA
jgi:hypothetical protein